eukprot:CAMPEP_0171738880 /NCGR_PEP_ID=MMETSP0991-20121206/33879_1 /TAXON_ID=483369 /ORGANISM="non described non described, Strain CCMP2098" /LENGTH=59 /DNA_ID=CAMNT_0012336347 /DNA_START=494 /DNA_END=670 /DNA_ORIENTATION=-
MVSSTCEDNTWVETVRRRLKLGQRPLRQRVEHGVRQAVHPLPQARAQDPTFLGAAGEGD